jgi:hypothetical protein
MRLLVGWSTVARITWPLVLAVVCGLASPQEVRQFRVLLTPSDRLPTPGTVRAGDLSVTAGAVKYAVQDARPISTGVGRDIVVVDMGVSAPNVRCVLAEAFEGIQHLPAQSPAVLVGAGEEPGLVASVSFGGGSEIKVFEGDDWHRLAGVCEAGRDRGTLPTRPWIRSSVNAGLALWEISNSLGAREAPVRVFWLGERFDWFDSRAVPGCADATLNTPCQHIEANAAVREMSRLGEAGVTVYPIVFGYRGKGGQQPPLGWQMGTARYMARYLGGFATAVNGPPGNTLAGVIDKVHRSAVISIEGPVFSDDRHPSSPKTLTIIDTAMAPPVIWKRPFVAAAAASVHRDPHLQLSRLAAPSDKLGLSSGCVRPGTEYSDALRISLPPEVATAPPGQVDVYVEYSNEGGLAKQRTTLERKVDSSTGLCMPLIHAREGTRFRIVILDRETGWLGARNGELVASRAPRK